MTDTVTRYYTGPIDEVTVVLEDGRQLDVARGDKIEVPEADAVRLDRQNTEDQTIWAKRVDSAAVTAARALPKPYTEEEAEEAARLGLGESLADEPELFDPAAHNVDEVLDYLATADAVERERVLDAEADGKARTTILTAAEPSTAPSSAPATSTTDQTGL